MKVFKNNEELKSYIKDGVIKIDDDIKCNFNIDVEADINAWNINAYDINADNINADNINARNIYAWDINADNINARNINAWDIKACDINADNISYYAFCISYKSLKCKSIEGSRRNSFHKCLDSEIEYIEENTELEALERKHKELGEEIQKLKNK